MEVPGVEGFAEPQELQAPTEWESPQGWEHEFEELETHYALSCQEVHHGFKGPAVLLGAQHKPRLQLPSAKERADLTNTAPQGLPVRNG